MPAITVKLQRAGAVEPAWPDLDREQCIHSTAPLNVAVLEEGMESGKPSVALRFDLPDGKHLIVETSALQILSLARIIRGRYPDLEG